MFQMKGNLRSTYVQPIVSLSVTVQISFSPQLLRQEIVEADPLSGVHGKQVEQTNGPMAGQAFSVNWLTGKKRTHSMKWSTLVGLGLY